MGANGSLPPLPVKHPERNPEVICFRVFLRRDVTSLHEVGRIYGFLLDAHKKTLYYD